MTDIYAIEDQILKGNDAKHLLDNPILKEAFKLIEDSLEDRALSTKTTDIKECQDVIRAKQILTGIQKAIYTFIEDGKFKQAELNAITKEKNSIFSRGY
jgi:hypothetical protein